MRLLCLTNRTILGDAASVEVGAWKLYSIQIIISEAQNKKYMRSWEFTEFTQGCLVAGQIA